MGEIEEQEQQPLLIVLFSGTDDKLMSASILAAGASAMGRKVHIMLQYWALDAFRNGALGKDHGVAPEAGVEGENLFRNSLKEGSHWSEVLFQAKEVGEVEIYACAASMEMLGITEEDLDPIVDGIEGVATFVGQAGGPVMFI